MIPCLYSQGETLFESNGIGKLCDAVSCVVTEKRNGSYELKMAYPVGGLHADSLIEDNIILAKPSEQGDPQPFRIYHVSTPLNGLLEVNARHISYQQNQITVSPFTAGSAQASLGGLRTNAASACPFTFETDIESNKQFTVAVPSTIRSCLGGMEGSILETYGGEFEWDMYRTILHAHRGADHGVKILYGKNLIDFQMERSIDSLMTGVHPYWYKQDTETGEETLIELPERIITVNIGQAFERIEPLDCSSVFSREPSLEQIRDYARWYLQDEKFSRPNADITVNFAQLWQLPGYEEIVEAERVSLCDTVHVFISRLNLEISYKVTETEYNVLLERYNSIVLSNEPVRSKNKRSYFVGTIADLQAQADATEAAAQRNSTDIQQVSYTMRDEVNGLESSISETASQIRSEVLDTANGLNSSITETASQIRSEVSDSVNGLNSSITETASQIRSEVSDSVNGLNSSITETASQIRSEVSDSVNGLNSSITETASQIRSEVSDSVNGLNSSITETASQIRSEVSDSVNGLTSSITETASQIRSEVSDSVNGLKSSITETASQIRSEVSDSVNGLTSSITETASQIRSEVSDSVNGLTSSITETASQIRSEVSDSVNGLSSSITETASQIRAELTDSVNGLSSSITATASQIRAELSDAKNGFNSSITATASQLRAEWSDSVNGLNASIMAAASQIRSEVTDKVNSVRSAFTQEASQIRQEIASATSAASIVAKINEAGSNVTLSADIIDLNGLVTAMQTHHIKVESINCTDWINIGDDIWYVSPGSARSNLSHGHTLTADSNGVVTMGGMTWDTSKMSFNMADTAWYAGRVSAIWTDASNTVDLQGRKNGSGSFASLKGQSYASGIPLSYGDSYEVRTVFKTGPSNPESSITRTITAPSSPTLSFAWAGSSKTNEFGVNLNNTASGLYGTLQSNGLDGVEMIANGGSYALLSLNIALEGKKSSDASYSLLNSRTPVTLGYGETYHIRAAWDGKGVRSSIDTNITAPASNYNEGWDGCADSVDLQWYDSNSGNWWSLTGASYVFTVPSGSAVSLAACYTDSSGTVHHLSRSVAGGAPSSSQIDLANANDIGVYSSDPGSEYTRLTQLGTYVSQCENGSWVTFRATCNGGNDYKYYKIHVDRPR